ncbi:MAG: tRNA 2-thiocytidine(32) synthetase TtcA [Clostridia bacterium]|nr:tRNA 2-thiocytidine(32) synthetase TtcA [Clostridia bacterium]
MKELQKVLSGVRRAVQHYDMIRPDDHIVVGLSGGKDSTALLAVLAAMRMFFPIPYRLSAVTVNMGFPGSHEKLHVLEQFCSELQVEYRIVETQIAQIVFEERKEKNPCSLCAKLRRGALNNAALEIGAAKIALGHHLDDAVETFMMSVMHEGRIGCFSPVTWYDDQQFSVIRPLIYTPEREIKALVRAAGLPVIESSCPENGNTEREEMKLYLRTFDNRHHGLYKRVLGALERREIDGWHT